MKHYKMRILQGMTNIAKQGYMNADGLRKCGEWSKLYVYHEGYSNQKNDYNLNIWKSKCWLYPYYVVKLAFFNIYAILRFNVFHFHFGKTMLPLNLDLPILKLLGKKVFMEYHGGDIRFMLNSDRGSFDPEYVIADPASPLHRNCINRIFRNVECIILHDSELRKYLVNYSGDVAYIPLRLDIDQFLPHYPDPENKKIVIVHAPTNREGKGTKFVTEAIERLKEKYEFEFILVEHKTNDEAKEIYKKADIVIDQLRGGTYGVLSIESMAMGKPVICYVSDTMKKDFPDELPIVSASIYDVGEKIEKLILNGELRYELGIKGRKYAECYHDYRYDTMLLREIYKGKYRNETQKKAFQRVRAIYESNKNRYTRKEGKNATV